jgi:hypothetical protein
VLSSPGTLNIKDYHAIGRFSRFMLFNHGIIGYR